MPVITVSRTAAALAALLTASTIALGAVGPAAAATVCGPAGYAAPIATTTSLTLSRSVQQAGSTNVAKIRVSSGAGTPSGTVQLSVSDGSSYTLPLNGGGIAQQALPRTLRPSKTYTVTASYDGQGTCRPSGPVSKYVSVVRAHTAVRGLAAQHARRGAATHVTGRVASSTGYTPRGQVWVRLVHLGTVRQERVVRLHDGRFAATLRAAGKGWTVRAALLQNAVFRGSHAVTGVRSAKR